MVVIPEYDIQKSIYANDRVIIYRGKHSDTGQPVIIKMFKSEYPTPKQIASLRHEYELMKKTEIQGVVKVLQFITIQHQPVLIMEDDGSISLRQYLLTYKLGLSDFLGIAIQLVDILEKLHQCRIIHKDIKPDNIIIHPHSLKVKMMDFSNASAFSREHPLFHTDYLEGTLAYMSPEQTGRMNRSIDYRTDYYSLGITLYEMLSGQIPFQSEDPMEMIYSHLAKKPTPLARLDNGIPESVSAIVMKCMAKNAEDRYQSAYGLKEDLKICLQEWEEHTLISDFPIGRFDRSETLRISQTLYGRERETEELRRVLARAESGQVELLLISGYSGSGKTSLVYELYRSVSRIDGFFISGKFDQYKRDIPYSAWIEAIRDMIRQLLTKSEGQILIWRNQIQEALGQSGQLLIDFVPELQVLIGPQPAMPKLPATDAHRRFHHIIQSLMLVFMRRQKPLFVFLDDMQWVDSASLSLMKELISSPSSAYVCVIGAYRDQEVPPNHPFMLALEQLPSTMLVNKIFLSSLKPKQVQQMVANALGQPEDVVLPLVESIYHKTEGNPFFTNQFLISLYEEEILTFHYPSGTWTWDIERIEKISSTDQVIDRMVQRFHKLSEQSSRLITLASCIGNPFDLYTVAMIAQMSLSDTAAALLEAIEERLIIPLNDNYMFIQYPQDENWQASYRFMHDRIQQAAYLMISEQTRQETHLQIGRSLLNHYSQEQLDENVYTVVHQLNVCSTLLSSDEKNKLCELNIIAGRRAMNSGAYDAAAEYLRLAVHLLEDHSWHSNYDMTYALYTELSEAEYLSGNFEQAEQWMRVALAHARSKLDQAKIHGLKAVLYTSMNKYSDAVDEGLKALRLFNIRTPFNPSKLAIFREYLKIRWRMRKRTVDDLLALPVMQNEEIKAIMQVMFDSPSYLINTNLFIYFIMRMTDLSLRYGNTEISAVAYSAFGFITTALGNTKLGYEMGNMALQLNEQLPHSSYRSVTYYGYGNTTHHWSHPIRTAIPYLRTSYEAGVESGNFVYANFSCSCIILMTEYMGSPLSSIVQEIDNYYPFVERSKNEDMRVMFSLVTAMIRHLQGRSFDFSTFDCDEFKEDRFLQYANNPENRLLLQFYYLFKAQALYLFEAYDEALLMIERSWDLLDSVVGMINIPKTHFYYFVILCAVYPQSSSLKKREIKKILRKLMRKMNKWATHSPHNYKHQALLMRAEYARLSELDTDAETYYDESIQAATEDGFQQHAAMGCELAAKYYASRGLKRIAHAYMTDAYYLFNQWGATAKAEQLLLRYPELITSSSTNAGVAKERTTTLPVTTQSSKETSSDELDLVTVLKATHAISGQIIQENLVKQLMELVMENAGAEKAVLLFQKQGEWFAQAEFDVRKQRFALLDDEPLDNANYISASVVRYVARSLDVVVLDDAASANSFSSDEYIQTNRPKSLLCIPILHQGKLSGILYLENNLTPGVFTVNRLQVLSMLASQFAISMENSRLYSSLERSRDEISKFNLELEQKVKDRTLELEQALETVKQAQTHLVQSEKMVALGNLVAGVAHEINTPIGISVTLASYIDQKTKTIEELSKVNQLKKSDFEDYVQTMSESSNMVLTNLKRASELISSFKQVAVDQSSGQRRQFYVKPYMNEMLLSLGLPLKKTKHQVVIDCDDQLSIYSDPGALSQIVTNLVMNSLSHAFAPSDLGLLQIVIHTEADHLIIRYKDNGKGMTPEAVQKIFDPFYTTKRGSGGTGLGMHIVYNIVTQSLKGSIECASELGRGTAFTIRFPLKVKELS